MGAVEAGGSVPAAVVARSSTPRTLALPKAADGSDVTTTTAPESATWWPASVAVKVGLTGVAAAPSRHAAMIVTSSSTRLGSITATTDPAVTPRAASCSATASTRSPNAR